MFFSNERHAQSSKHSGDRKEPMHVDEVRSAVALEFFRMDQQHARIREETLAPSGPVSTRNEAVKDQSRS